ncbi:uncharacterized protein LOC62_05G007377 [Vanrija pseudolonga]|uniref:Uncharacterized protein n=1 Tax=Vanrija pseudolonga TaxID=143232 RepID=A0AAF0YCC7_9TREE|nr:hypothetical protein LOC62_05G007377 [Vanrija pseudolonga]WOO83857.1 hypothetical protein LOC62_05G007377 [Vanrija pseudolonga]
MPSQPIPINTHTDGPTVNASGTPQTPFAGGAVGLGSSAPGSIFAKWSAFSTVKSPTTGGGNSPPRAMPAISPLDDDNDDIGDLNDLKSRGWAAAAAARGQRRAVSLSMSPGSSLLSGNYSITSTTNSSTGSSPPTSFGNPLMNDKMARGEGVLRRLSMGGGFGRPTVPPPVPEPPSSTPIASLPQQQPTLAAHPPPQAEVARANTVGGGRRRFSESAGRRRPVSPMGERILRDQVHF